MQGSIDGEEDARAAAFREPGEEMGVTSAEYLGEVRSVKNSSTLFRSTNVS